MIATRPPLDSTILLGTILVIALVALQPLALGCFPSPCDGEAGIGTGAGDLSAGALCSMVRDLNSEAPTRAAEGTVASVVLLPLPERERDTQRYVREEALTLCTPATTLAGTSDRGYPLLL